MGSTDIARTRIDPDAIVRSERVEIAAPVALVWAILIDLPNYGVWNPFCFECSSTLEMAAPVVMKLNSYTDPGIVFDNVEYVCAYEPERLLSWELPWNEAWPYPARRDQILEKLDDSNCAYNSTDAFYGDNGIHVMRFCGSWVKRAFDETAFALKARAETLYTQQRDAA